MVVKEICKVQARYTSQFKDIMHELRLRQNAPVTLSNICAGYNYFYVSDESYGDITKDTALRMAEQNDLEIIEF